MRTLFLVFLATITGIVVYTVLGGKDDIAIGLAILSVVAVLWLTEALHVSITALLVPLLAVATGVLDLKAAMASFANPIIYLFMGGFALAAALKAHRIDQWLAVTVIRLARGQTRLAVVYLFFTTAFISMWISNTATTAMMLPVALGLLVKASSASDDTTNANTTVFVLLGIAYSANIGGIGTLVGSPPNAIAASILQIDFASWLKMGMPLLIILLPLSITVLWLMLKPDFSAFEQSVAGSGSSGASSLADLPQQDISEKFQMQWTPGARAVLMIFAIVVTLWLFSTQVSQTLGIEKDFDAFVAIGAIIILIGSGLLSWQDYSRTTDWGVLILFGGGITLSVVLSQTQASVYLADQLVSLFDGAPAWAFLAIAITLMIFLTELASNTASAALLVPIFYSLPQDQTGLPPELLAVGVAIAASCAFMLPVATPPNALVFGTGRVPQRNMVKCGFVINIVCILVLTVFLYW